MLTVSLLHGAVPFAVVGLALAGLGWLIAARGRRWWLRLLPLAVVLAAIGTTGIVLAVEKVWRPFPDALPPEVVVSGGLGVFALVAAVVRIASTRSWWQRAALPLAAILVLVGAASEINRYYAEFPTAGALMQVPLPNQVSLAKLGTAAQVVKPPPGGTIASVWHAPADLPAHGAVVADAAIPATVSGFHARKAFVYLPPAYLTTPRAELPVLVLTSGTPGSPHDWFGAGLLSERLDRFAAAHHGLAPVVVVPDILGSAFANPLCLDSKLGKSATYLDVDVPAWIHSALQVDPDSRHWSVGGLSSGGTCALQAGIRSPKTFPTILDISGQDEPTLGGRARTVKATFGGDNAKFRAVSPLVQLAHTKLPGSAAMLTAGNKDKIYGPQQRRVLAALRRAGVPAQFTTVPGAHSWSVFGPALEKSLPWLASRLGLA
jgi:enterochelin esterase-like enzyme